jgi:hypothetical protein
MTDTSARNSRLFWVEVVVSAVLIVLAFVAIGSTDLTTGRTHLLWSLLIVAYGVAGFVFDRLHRGGALSDWHGALSTLLHWAGVLVAVQITYFFVDTGRMANADTGLTNGLILALGTFTAGAHGNWRQLIVGTAVALAVVGVAVVEEYLWLLFLIAVAAVAVLVVGHRALGKHRADRRSAARG